MIALAMRLLKVAWAAAVASAKAIFQAHFRMYSMIYLVILWEVGSAVADGLGRLVDPICAII